MVDLPAEAGEVEATGRVLEGPAAGSPAATSGDELNSGLSWTDVHPVAAVAGPAEGDPGVCALGGRLPSLDDLRGTLALNAEGADAVAAAGVTLWATTSAFGAEPEEAVGEGEPGRSTRAENMV